MPIKTRSKAAAAAAEQPAAAAEQPAAAAEQPAAKQRAAAAKVSAVEGMTVSEVRRAMDAARTQWRDASPLSAPLCACGEEMLTLQGFCTRFVLGQHKKRKRAAHAD
jgi:hypothetical protein